MRRFRWVPMLLVLVAAGAASARAQNEDWQHKWFWGVKGGGTMYSLPTAGRSFRAGAGAEWMVTGARSALYVGYSQTLGVSETDTFRFKNLTNPVTVGFNGMHRIQVALLVFPTDGTLQPYAGGGFVIETLPNPTRISDHGTSANTSIDNDLQNKASGGFLITMIGAQLRMRRLALFGHVQFSPQGQSFLLGGGSTSIEVGVRYALTSSRVDDITTRR